MLQFKRESSIHTQGKRPLLRLGRHGKDNNQRTDAVA